MRQVLMILTAMLLTCCSSDHKIKAETNQTLSNMGKTLIVYYSYTGNCKAIVNSLAAKIPADQQEILPTEKGLRYEADNYAIGMQLLNAIKANPNDAGSYPSIDPVTTNLDDYQNIIIVTPLWWSQMAAVMQSYLFQNSENLAGKTVGLIVSSHSSGISGVVADTRRLLPGVTWAGDALWINNSNHSNRTALLDDWLLTQNFNSYNNMEQKIYITINGVTKSATLVSNSSTEALARQLKQGDITYEAHDYGDFEKVGALGYTFPQNNEQITTAPGDLILYLGSNLCIYYDTNSWSFTRIGKLDGMTQGDIKTWLHAGGDNVSVILSTHEPTGIKMVQEEQQTGKDAQTYTLQGTVAQTETKGIVIQNGKKQIR